MAKYPVKRLLSMSPELDDAVRVAAERDRRTVTNFIRLAIERQLATDAEAQEIEPVDVSDGANPDRVE